MTWNKRLKKDSSARTSNGRVGVAVAYDGKETPWVSHLGRDRYVEAMISVARRYGIHIRYDADLVRELSKLEEFDSIPDSLYEPVARLLCDVDEGKKQ